ncbi:MAG TPA: septum formation initiator family protein [Candidatus Acidoferrales bacterium]|nr:septum formation initiator family protein [Candidatus Acidoferrales bacterium]
MDHGLNRHMENNVDDPIDDQSQSFFRRNLRYFFALAFFLLLLQDVFGTHGLVAMRRSKIQIQAVQAQIQQLDQENQELQQRIHSLKTDPAAIEKIARDRMGLARPGEMIFQLPDSPNSHAPQSPSATPNPKK